jgi:HK97 family phage major capsid protein
MTDKDPNELRRKRVGLLEECRQLIDTAESDKRNLTSEENGRVAVIMDKADRLAHAIKELDPTSKPLHLSSSRSLKEMQIQLKDTDHDPMKPDPNEGLSVRGNTTSSATPWKTADGKELRVLQPKDRFVDSVQPSLPDGIQAGDLSFGRMVRGIVTGNWRGCEAEQRAVTKGGSGDFLVPEILSGMMIDLARDRSVCFKAGAQVIPMNSGDLKIVKVLTDPTPEWHAELADITESAPTFGAVTLRPRTLVALCRASVELLEDSSNASNLIERTLSGALAEQLDAAILRGAGGLAPLGIKNQPGVQHTDLGTNGAALTSYAAFSAAWAKVIAAGGPADNLSMIISAREAGTLDGFINVVTGDPLVMPPSVQKMKQLFTTAIPHDQTWGTASTASEAYVGDFSQVLVGMRTSLTIEASRQAGTAFTTLSVLIRAYLRADVVLAHENWLVVLDGII